MKRAAIERGPASLSSRRRSRDRRTGRTVSTLPLQYLSHRHVTYAVYYAAFDRSGRKLLRGPLFESVACLARSLTRESKHLFDLSGCEVRPRSSLRSAFLCTYSRQTVRVELPDPLLNIGRMRSKELTYLGRRFAFSGQQNDARSNGLLLVRSLGVLFEPFTLVARQRSDKQRLEHFCALY